MRRGTVFGHEASFASCVTRTFGRRFCPASGPSIRHEEIAFVEGFGLSIYRSRQSLAVTPWKVVPQFGSFLTP